MMSACRFRGAAISAVMLVGWTGLASAQLDVASPKVDRPVAEEAVQVIRGLKNRHLFDLAQRYASDQLALDDLDRIDRSTVVIEQIRNAVAKAIHSTGEQRNEAWLAAEQIAKEFLDSDPDHPQRLLVETQRALTHLAHGRLIQQEIAAAMIPPDERDRSLEQFRRTTTIFRDVEREIDRMLPIQRNRTLSAGELSPDRLLRLKTGVRFELARVNLARAEMYDADDQLNRIDALNQVLTGLNDVLAQSNPEMPVWWRAQVARARCYRLMGKTEAAVELFQGLPEIELTADLVAMKLSEQLLLAATTPDEDARKVWEQAARMDQPTPQLQMAQLRLLLARAVADAASTDAPWTRQAVKLVQDIQSAHGEYWGRRAEIALVAAVKVPADQAQINASEFEILVRQGDAAFRQQNFEDAMRAYDKAVAFAEVAGNIPQAVALTVRLARCHEMLHQHRQAARRLLAVAEKYPDTEDAAAIHLRGCWNEAQLRGHDDPPASNVDYLAHLQTLIETWPESDAADQARLWQAYHYQAIEDWPSALRSFLAISLTSPQMLSALPHIQTAADRLCRSDSGDSPNGDSSNGDSPVKPLVDQLVDKLQPENSRSKSTESEQRLLLVLIQCALVTRSIDATDLARWLDRAVDNADPTMTTWRQQAAAWQLVLDAVQSKPPLRLQNRLVELPNRADLMEIGYGGLEPLTGDQRKSYAQVIETICSKALADDGLTGPQRAAWETRLALAQAQTGKFEAAHRNLQDLAERYPGSLEIQLQLARVTSQLESTDPAALDQWRWLAGRLKPGTEPWFEAKYNVARELADRDRGSEAVQLLRYLQATQLQWQSSRWAEAIESLLQELEPTNAHTSGRALSGETW